MNSLLEFINNVNSEQLPFIITKSFNELMVLYNLIGNCKDMSIDTEQAVLPIVFKLTMDSDNSAEILYNRLNNYEFSVYESKYIILMDLLDNLVSTTIKAIS